MKSAIFTFVLLSGLLLSSAGFSSEKVFSANLPTEQSQLTEWVEYVLIGDQWFTITHFDDGSEIIQAYFIGSSD